MNKQVKTVEATDILKQQLKEETAKYAMVLSRVNNLASAIDKLKAEIAEGGAGVRKKVFLLSDKEIEYNSAKEVLAESYGRLDALQELRERLQSKNLF